VCGRDWSSDVCYSDLLTTKQAKNELNNSKKAKTKIDSIAACIMLQTFLDSRKSGVT
jgi:RNase H-fold protein (predicted Holliday junction resolvase)